MATEQPLKARQVPMEVLALGLCRTGTSSLKTALEKLGYTEGQGVYHMSTSHRDPSHREKWKAALEAKYEVPGCGPKFTKEQWDDLLGEYCAVSDIPASIFVEELIEAYPDAKVILTSRSPESWYNSMLQTVYAAYTDPWRRAAIALHVSGVSARKTTITCIFENTFLNDFPRFGVRVMKEHDELVRRVAPPGQFLDMDFKQGWGPLCELLGKEVPEEEFPRVNDMEQFRGMSVGYYEKLILMHFAKIALVGIPVVAGAAVAWQRWGRKLLK